MSSCIPPNDRPVRGPRYGALPKWPVSSSSTACRGCRRVGLIESYVPSGVWSPEFPPGFLGPGEDAQVNEFVTQINAIYRDFDRARRTYLAVRESINAMYADDVWSHARKHASNDHRLLETIQRMRILESEPKDWVKMDFNSNYMMPECFFRLDRERRRRRAASRRAI